MKGFLSLLPVQRLRVQVKIGCKLVALTMPSPYPSACRESIRIVPPIRAAFLIKGAGDKRFSGADKMAEFVKNGGNPTKFTFLFLIFS